MLEVPQAARNRTGSELHGMNGLVAVSKSAGHRVLNLQGSPKARTQIHQWQDSSAYDLELNGLFALNINAYFYNHT